jgi:DNA transformation protein and related proteins
MATKEATVEFILDQLSGAGEVRARKMFGEYAIYCNEKVVALICDDQLFVKITDAGKKFIGEAYEEGFAYPGAKLSMRINEEMLEDRERLSELIRLTAEALPMPKPKKFKLKKPKERMDRV